jgi:hypothetical protein
MWKEMVVAFVKVLFRRFLGGNEEIREKAQVGRPECGL